VVDGNGVESSGFSEARALWGAIVWDPLNPNLHRNPFSRKKLLGEGKEKRKMQNHRLKQQQQQQQALMQQALLQQQSLYHPGLLAPPQVGPHSLYLSISDNYFDHVTLPRSSCLAFHLYVIDCNVSRVLF